MVKYKRQRVTGEGLWSDIGTAITSGANTVGSAAASAGKSAVAVGQVW